ncbi:MAG: serine hydrolase domain-containing protein [Candidatus Thorarchaeota archaeon]|jgi:CubicO group peptidase (beta-lactamase class C family)
MKSESVLLVCILLLSSVSFTTGDTTISAQHFMQLEQSLLSNTNITRNYWPTDGWRNSTPEAKGMQSSVLNDMLEYIEAEDYRIDSILIVKNGSLVFEEYPSELYNADRRHELHSVTKSFASTLIGIALQQGLIGSVNEYMMDFFPEYTSANPDPRRNNITIEHLLTMTAGFEWDESTLPFLDPEVNDIGGIFAAEDGVQFVLDKPMVYHPGEHWLYSGGVSLLLGAIVQQVAGVSLRNFADEYLFDPLGFDGVSWFQTPGGWYNTLGGQLRIRSRDLARLGFLYLNNGNWNGTQILSEDYVKNATTPIGFSPFENAPEYGYGWQWWTRSDLGIYFAMGLHGQKIMVSPEHDMVVVFTALMEDYDPEFYLFNEYILGSLEPSEDIPLFDPLIIGIVLSVGCISLASIVIYLFKRRTQ